MHVAEDKQWWSPRYFELLGYEPDEIEPSLSAYLSRIHPEDQQRIDEAWRANFDEGVPFDVELRLKTRSGEYRWFRSRGNTMRDAAGKPVRMAGSLRDIHQRKLEREAIEESERKFRTLTENVPGVIYLCENNDAYTMLFVNDAIQELTGYPKEIFLECNISYSDLIHEDDQESRSVECRCGHFWATSVSSPVSDKTYIRRMALG